MGILNLSDEEKILAAHAKDCIARCESRSQIEYTDFLSDRERAVVIDAAAACGFSDRILCFGGYADCERAIVAFLPDYCAYLEKEELEADFPISAIEICCSGFREHNHRDFLGSILGLGLKRSVIGDIIVGEKGYSAVVFIHNRIKDFIIDNLKLVGRDGVKISAMDIGNIPNIEREFEIIHGTVASFRIDAVISEVLSISREKAQNSITQGMVTINHEELSEKDKSRTLELYDVFTIRGSGKFRLSYIGDRNRKDRIRFEVQKYI